MISKRKLLIAGLALTGLAAWMVPSSAEDARVIPAPTVDEQPAPTATSEIALLAGGCFWGIQGVFQHVEGVTSAVSGYAGGEASTAQYETVGSGDTGHAESVQITYDPRKISYGKILQIYFSVAHDPTQLNRQGPDKGPQYRSTIFPMNDEQAKIAQAYVAHAKRAAANGALVGRRGPDRPRARRMYPSTSDEFARGGRSLPS